MRFLPIAVHGIIDYLAAIALIAGPLVLFPADTSAIVKYIPVIAGAALIGYSLITDYSTSVRKAIPFKVHLLFDGLAGAAFVALAFVLGLSGVAQAFYLVMGVAVIIVVLVSKTE